MSKPTENPTELPAQRQAGPLCEEDATITPIRNAAGETTNFVAVKRDVTHELQLEAQFRQAQKMEALGMLAAASRMISTTSSQSFSVTATCSSTRWSKTVPCWKKSGKSSRPPTTPRIWCSRF